jgi:hypothetical protein
MTELSKAYEPHSVEEKWYPIWHSRGYFKPRGEGPTYCITIRPERHGLTHRTRSLLLHPGRVDPMEAYAGLRHALCARHRSRGIATQNVIETAEERGLTATIWAARNLWSEHGNGSTRPAA